MTTVYFVRHAEPDYKDHNDWTRPLTEKGKRDVKLVNQFFRDKDIDVVLSSPFTRAVETVAELADRLNKKVIPVEDFRERKIDNCWIEDFNDFSLKQWSDFNYKLSDGECLREVQQRNIKALKSVIAEYRDKKVVVGSHGTALSTIINFFDNTYGFNDFKAMKTLMPWIVMFTFESDWCTGIEKINVFELQ